MLKCQSCEEETVFDELESHPDVEPVSVNDYVWCPHCLECKEFTSDQGNVEF
jgi:hypothetical protein